MLKVLHKKLNRDNGKNQAINRLGRSKTVYANKSEVK